MIPDCTMAPAFLGRLFHFVQVTLSAVEGNLPVTVTLAAVEGNLPVTVPVALESFWLWKKVIRLPHYHLPAAN